MSIDASTLPVSPVLIIALAGYAALSALVTGPGIIGRELAVSNWQASCQADIEADLVATRRPDQTIPAIPDVGGMLCSFYPELSDLCALIPDPTAGLRATEAQLRAAEAERLRRVAADAPDQCFCAEQIYIENNRLSIALYAASGRLITPVAVSGRDSSLSRALHGPACAIRGEG